MDCESQKPANVDIKSFGKSHYLIVINTTQACFDLCYSDPIKRNTCHRQPSGQLILCEPIPMSISGFANTCPNQVPDRTTFCFGGNWHA